MNRLFNRDRPALFWGMFLFILLVSFASLWQRDRMRRMGYAINEMQRKKIERVKLNKALLIEVERLNALDRIEAVATDQLSMVPASPAERIYVPQRLGTGDKK